MNSYMIPSTSVLVRYIFIWYYYIPYSTYTLHFFDFLISMWIGSPYFICISTYVNFVYSFELCAWPCLHCTICIIYTVLCSLWYSLYCGVKLWPPISHLSNSGITKWNWIRVKRKSRREECRGGTHAGGGEEKVGNARITPTSTQQFSYSPLLRW